MNKKKSKTLKKINDQSGKMMFVIIIKKYPLNIFKMSQWSYLIKKIYIKWEWDNLIKKSNSITSK
jgi:hypothetical protein